MTKLTDRMTGSERKIVRLFEVWHFFVNKQKSITTGHRNAV